MLKVERKYWLKIFAGAGLLTLLYALFPMLLNVKGAYLKTDILVYMLVISVAVFIAYIRQQKHLSEPWRDVFRNKIGMACAVILGFFIIVGLMDSIHYRNPVGIDKQTGQPYYAVEVTSVLDASLGYFRYKIEKTYSAPFATHSYAKENFTNEQGITYRDFPRLKYAGAHLANPDQDIIGDISRTILLGIFIGLVVFAVYATLIILFLGFKHRISFTVMANDIVRRKTAMPWHVMLLTSAIIIIISTVLLMLSNDYHVMGTDKVGQDVFYLSLKSIRTGLVIGTLTTLIMLPFAIALGIMAGYFKGWVDDVIQYIYTTLNSIPGVLLIVAVMLAIDVYIKNHPNLFETSVERADLKLLALCIVLGITSWTGLCRLLRGEALKLRELEYIQAARALGVSHTKILVRHIMPNVMHIVLIIVVLDFSSLVLAEAVLAYIGVGVDPSTISWGNMINSARMELAREPVVWWSLTAAFSLMFTLVLAANLFADAVRDAFDPHTQTGARGA